MKQTNDKLQRTKAFALVSITLGLMLALSQSAWAGGKKTHFTTTLVTLAGPPSGTVFADDENLYIMASESAMTEAASDPRVTGSAVITVDAVFDLQALTGPMWGKSHRPHANGAWDGYWRGTRTAFEDPPDTWHVRSTIVSLAVGSGAFAGLVARWDLTGVDVDLGNPLTGSGYIIEAKGGPGERPMQWRSQGTESVGIHPGIFLAPPPGGPGAMITWELLSEVAQVSHLGRSADQGFGLLNPLTGEVSGAGVLTSANGDELNWVATGTSLGPSGPVDLTLHWVGGTGRFEAAVGEINGMLMLDPREGTPLMDLSLNAHGTIRY